MAVHVADNYSSEERQLMRTLEVQPRNYGLVYKRNGTRFYFFPSAHIMARLHSLDPSVIRERLLEARDYQLRYEAEAQHGFEMQFPWKKRYLHGKSHFEK